MEPLENHSVTQSSSHLPLPPDSHDDFAKKKRLSEALRGIHEKQDSLLSRCIALESSLRELEKGHEKLKSDGKTAGKRYNDGFVTIRNQMSSQISSVKDELSTLRSRVGTDIWRLNDNVGFELRRLDDFGHNVIEHWGRTFNGILLRVIELEQKLNIQSHRNNSSKIFPEPEVKLIQIPDSDTMALQRMIDDQQSQIASQKRSIDCLEGAAHQDNLKIHHQLETIKKENEEKQRKIDVQEQELSQLQNTVLQQSLDIRELRFLIDNMRHEKSSAPPLPVTAESSTSSNSIPVESPPHLVHYGEIIRRVYKLDVHWSQVRVVTAETGSKGVLLKTMLTKNNLFLPPAQVHREKRGLMLTEEGVKLFVEKLASHCPEVHLGSVKYPLCNNIFDE